MASSRQNGAIHHRPGGRTARTTERIHDSVLSLLTTQGHEACTFQNVAARAGVERSTLYRRYPDRWTMIIDAYATRAEANVRVDPTGDFTQDFKELTWRFGQLWATNIGEAMLAMVLALRGTPAQQHVDDFLEKRFAEFDALFDEAIDRGNIPPSIDRREILERAIGAVIFRQLIANRMADRTWIDRLVTDLVRAMPHK